MQDEPKVGIKLYKLASYSYKMSYLHVFKQ